MSIYQDEKSDTGPIPANSPAQSSSKATLDESIIEKYGTKEASISGHAEESPTSTVYQLPPAERWNYPRKNIGKSLVAFYGLTIMGANDAAYGVRMSGYGVLAVRILRLHRQ
jgi:hypothetical protein